MTILTQIISANVLPYFTFICVLGYIADTIPIRPSVCRDKPKHSDVAYNTDNPDDNICSEVKGKT